MSTEGDGAKKPPARTHDSASSAPTGSTPTASGSGSAPPQSRSSTSHSAYTASTGGGTSVYLSPASAPPTSAGGESNSTAGLGSTPEPSPMPSHATILSGHSSWGSYRISPSERPAPPASASPPPVVRPKRNSIYAAGPAEAVAPQPPAAGEEQLPRPPETTEPDAADSAAIKARLAKKKHRPRLRRGKSSDSEDSSFDPIALHRELRKEAAACELQFKHIDLEVDGKIVHTEAQIPPVKLPKKAHYAWEIMYENQRGMYIFGKSWYSYNALLPTDPTPYTLPISPPEGDFTLARMQNGLPHEHVLADSPRFKRKSIKTAYQLWSYQTPSPAWAWLTPWMANMRHDTDEQGWRYNLWFQTRHWRAHPGRLNWWGWVRRREWVRLRALLPAEGDDDDGDDGTATPVAEPTSLDEVLDAPRPVANMARFMAQHALDREKLAMWEGWLKHSTSASRHKLAEILEDPEKLSFLARAFIFPTAREGFFSSLVAHGLVERKDCIECASTYELTIEE